MLKAQMMGLNTCWAALTFCIVKSAYTLNNGEKLAAVVVLSHGDNKGFFHTSKTMDEVSKLDGLCPIGLERGWWLFVGANSSQPAEVPVHADGGRSIICPAGSRILCEDGSGHYQISF